MAPVQPAVFILHFLSWGRAPSPMGLSITHNLACSFGQSRRDCVH
jgi:hypothetical protein